MEKTSIIFKPKLYFIGDAITGIRGGEIHLFTTITNHVVKGIFEMRRYSNNRKLFLREIPPNTQMIIYQDILTTVVCWNETVDELKIVWNNLQALEEFAARFKQVVNLIENQTPSEMHISFEGGESTQAPTASPTELDLPSETVDEHETIHAQEQIEYEALIIEFIQEISQPGKLEKMIKLQKALQWKWGKYWVPQLLSHIKLEK